MRFSNGVPMILRLDLGITLDSMWRNLCSLSIKHTQVTSHRSSQHYVYSLVQQASIRYYATSIRKTIRWNSWESANHATRRIFLRARCCTFPMLWTRLDCTISVCLLYRGLVLLSSTVLPSFTRYSDDFFLLLVSTRRR